MNNELVTVTRSVAQDYLEIVTLLHEYALVNESPTDTLSRLLTESEELRTAALREPLR